MTLVSSVNNIGFDTEFIFTRKLFTYIMNNRGPRIYPWGMPCLNLPQSENKVLVVFGDFNSTFCLLLVKQDLN
jgi:hypothetical protein